MTQDSVFPSVIMAFTSGESHARDMMLNAFKNVKFLQPVMVWGYMSATDVRKICFLKRLINAAVYQDVLDHFLIPYIEDKFWDFEFIFY